MTADQLEPGVLVRVGKAGARCWRVVEVRHGWLADPTVVLRLSDRLKYVRMSEVREIVDLTQGSE